MEYLKRQNPWLVSFVLSVCVVSGYQFAFGAPHTFVPKTIVEIPSGASASEAAKALAAAHVIAHPSIFTLALRVSGQSANIQAGLYEFDAAGNVFSAARRVVEGEYGLSPVRLTFTEGTTIREDAERISAALPNISPSDFTTAAEHQEGYLFPDTYFLQPGMSAEAIVATMRSNFDAKLAPLASEIIASGHSLHDILTMASIIEKEARTDEDRHMISGILWNRIRLHMPLQVDAVFGYIYNRDTYSPSFADLEVDSPYNTYSHQGLPPGPINNPGLDAIKATLEPTKTNYLYYLTDAKGVMHYATTYAGHQENLRKYLK